MARQLRRRQTPAEQRVWRWLRHRYLGGLKFRRQHPIDRFILDFYCLELKLAIELDGLGHDQPRQLRYDALRTRDLAAHGIRVFRLRNEIVLQNPDGAWEMIAMCVAEIVAARDDVSYEAVLRSLLSG